ncbi:MAG: hypothetical protein K9G57_09095 [Ignavibacteriales bacterium]|nr:hypothetical protein [Ignavibacteriales bacterium]
MRQEKLGISIEYSEVFPALFNNEECLNLIKQSAQLNKYDFVEIERLFKWSEDFGYYTEKNNAGFFGLVSGKNYAALNNPDFDFLTR